MFSQGQLTLLTACCAVLRLLLRTDVVECHVVVFLSSHDLAPRWRRADHLRLGLRWRSTVPPLPPDEEKLGLLLSQSERRQAYRDVLVTIIPVS